MGTQTGGKTDGGTTSGGSNQGEGNKEAAKRFNDAEQKFVNSSEGKQKIQKGPQVRPEEEAELERAEKAARSHGKNDPEI